MWPDDRRARRNQYDKLRKESFSSEQTVQLASNTKTNQRLYFIMDHLKGLYWYVYRTEKKYIVVGTLEEAISLWNEETEL